MIHKILITRQQRSFLAEITCHQMLRIRGLDLVHLRRAFGISRAAEVTAHFGKHAEHMRQDRAQHVAELTTKDVHTALNLLNAVDIPAIVNAVIAPVLEQLEQAQNGTLAHDTSTLPGLIDESSEKWDL